MNEKQERSLRRKAIRLWLQGLNRRDILARISRSCAWLCKWQKRFTEIGWAGLRSHSRQPHHLASRYDARTRRLVRQARQRLVKRKVGLIGPQAVQDELRAAHLVRPIPSVSTIRRILHEGRLIKTARPPSDVYFPQPCVTTCYVLHAMDWTARYLEGGPKVFAFHTLDLETHACQQTISTDKTSRTTRQHALQAWQTLGLPDGLQMDNDAAFCGGYKTPRVFGEFVRLCLYVGIEPTFLPVGEPKRNGIIERLNGLWSQTFWKRTRFASVAHVKRASPRFETWYAQRYQVPSLNRQTPAQAQAKVHRVYLTEQDIAGLPTELPITAGRVHFIRCVSEHGAISLLNEIWHIDKRLAGQYIWATIVTHTRQLKIYHRRTQPEPMRLIKEYRYEITESV
ncbi:MAG: integrase core domain-containing protein, partial [Acidobacteria bacterium]|nr:integrase core domain-containing protein [Acidobacteriota bacterium]